MLEHNAFFHIRVHTVFVARVDSQYLPLVGIYTRQPFLSIKPIIVA